VFSKEEVQIAKNKTKQNKKTTWRNAQQSGHKGSENQNHIKIRLTPVRMVIIKNPNNNKYWWGYKGKWTLIHCWWEGKLIQPLWKTVWGSSKN
jgi:hypothetical protein